MYEPPRPSPLEPPLTQQQKNWAMLAHLTGLSFLTVPFGNVVGPLLIWQIKRKELGEFVGASAREALNFQFTFLVIVAFAITLNVLPIPGIGRFSVLLLVALCLANVYFCLMAALTSNEGEVYRYPFAFRPF